MTRVFLLFILLFILDSPIWCLIFQSKSCETNNIVLLHDVRSICPVMLLFESYFRHHTKFIILLFIICGFFLVNIVTNECLMGCDCMFSVPFRLFALKSTSQQTRNKSHSKNTTRTKTFKKQHQHHDEHADT